MLWFEEFSANYKAYIYADTDFSDLEKEELRWRRISYYAFVIFILVIGTPIWYLTTTPYRAALPFFEEDYVAKIESIFTGGQSSSSMDEHSPDIWSQVTLSTHYNVHYVFVHDTADLGSPANAEATKRGIAVAQNYALVKSRQFAAIFNRSMTLRFSAEHIWDYSVAVRLAVASYSDQPLTVSGSSSGWPVHEERIPMLTSDIDRLTTASSTDQFPLIKLVVFVSDHRVEFFANGNRTSGLAVASWGGFLSLPRSSISNENEMKRTMSGAFAILRLQLGIKAARKRVGRASLATRWLALECHECATVHRDAVYRQLEAMRENLAHTVHYINSLHDLAGKIDDLVIPDEVAEMARQAERDFHRSFDSLADGNGALDSTSAASARLLAHRAVTHASLLEFLNFPTDQKYGVYVPLFFPVLIQLLGPPFNLLAYVLVKVVLPRLKQRARRPLEDHSEENTKKKDE